VVHTRAQVLKMATADNAELLAMGTRIRASSG